MINSTFSLNSIAAVKVDIIYAHRPDERLEMTVRATSSVSDVVDKFKSFIQVEGSKWKLDCDKVAVKHDGNTVDVKVPVVNFSLDLPFSFGKHGITCLCSHCYVASLSIQYEWICYGMAWPTCKVGPTLRLPHA